MYRPYPIVDEMPRSIYLELYIQALKIVLFLGTNDFLPWWQFLIILKAMKILLALHL